MNKVYFAGVDAIPQHITLAAGEELGMVVVVLPGVSCDLSVAVDLEGEGAKADVSGLFLCAGSDRLSIDIRVNHLAGGTESHQLFNGIAADKSRTSFNGRIYVKQDAQKIKAFQENHNILLSENARVETSPQLEIYADDVECSHGATTGFLNADEQFYMRSRGIPEQEAKLLQMVSFLAPVVAKVEDEAVREELSARVEAAIRSI